MAKRLKYHDNRYADQSAMTDAELDQHIENLKYSAADYHRTFDEEDISVLMMIQLAVGEKHNRAAIKQVEASNALARETLNLTKKTILLWWAAIILAALGVVVALWDKLTILFSNVVGMFP